VTDDLELATLLCTRLCHDMAGPVGAVHTGAELMAEDDDPAMMAETAGLLRGSAEAAAAKLRFLRAAFGLARGHSGGESAQSLARGYVAAAGGAAVTLDWREDGGPLGADSPAGQLVCNLVITALDSLHGNGRVAVAITQADGRGQAQVVAEGRRAALTAEQRAALEGDGRALSPRTVQPFFLFRLARGGGAIGCAESAGSVRLSADWNAPSA